MNAAQSKAVRKATRYEYAVCGGCGRFTLPNAVVYVTHETTLIHMAADTLDAELRRLAQSQQHAAKACRSGDRGSRLGRENPGNEQRPAASVPERVA